MTKNDKLSSPAWSPDEELNEFCNKLLGAVREMKSGQAARKTEVEVSWIVKLRNRTGLTQKQFARLLGVSVRTLQSWEQGARQPSGAAVTVLRLADMNPEALAKLAAS